MKEEKDRKKDRETEEGRKKGRDWAFGMR